MASLRFSLKEHDYYPTVNIVFSKPSASVLRIGSNDPSRGIGYAFIVVSRACLDGKYIRFHWQGTGNGDHWVSFQAFIMDGEYDRTSNTDFPTGAHIPNKGNGLLQMLSNPAGRFGWTTVDVLVNVAGGSEDKCTIFFRCLDAWADWWMMLDLDWFEINTGAGGAGPLYDEQFTSAITMEQTGTAKDYGYISSGEFIVAPTVLTNVATRCPAMDQATLNGNVTITGGENVTRGFRWGYAMGGPYPNTWSDAGTHGTGAYNHTIAGLTKDSTVYYTAVATNCAGTTYGAEQSFNTNPATPTNLAGTCVGFIAPNIIPIVLTWNDNSSIETAYYVERNDGGWHVISGALPANTQTYTDNTAICATAYSYRVRAYDGTCYSVYNTLGAPITCTCPTPEPEEEEVIVPEKQHIADAIKEWIWEYPFQSPTVEGIYCIVIAPFGETKPIKGISATRFEETRKVKGKTGERFEETTLSMIKSDIKKEFDETSINIVGSIGKKFEETKLIDVEWTFTLTVSTKIKGKTISKEEMLIDELYWL